MKILISALTIFVLLFVGVGGVLAAQNDLPTEPLYPVKTISEDVSLWLVNDPDVKMDRLVELAQIRTQEIAALVEQGETVPEQVAQRLQLHIETALQLAAGQSDEEMQESLLHLQSQLRTQEQVMTQLQTNAPEGDQGILEQARVRTQEQLRLANEGLEDPLAFRNRYQHQNQSANGTGTPSPTGVPSETATPPAPGGYGPGPSNGTPGPNATPGAGYGPGPDPSTTPGGNGNGGGSGSGGGGNGGGGGGGGSGGGGKP
ncbi:MAG: DUF5667 domain-containing protein [Chloroflexota bacterium]